MVAWRYEISLLVLKTISLVRAPTEEKFRISARASNILYLPNSLNQFLKEMHGEFVCRYRFKRVK